MRCAKRRRKNHHYTCLVCFAEFSSSIQYDQHKAQHNEVATYCVSDSEELCDSNTSDPSNPIKIFSPRNFNETPVIEVDPLDVSIILENSTEPETIVIDEDPLSPDIVTIDKDSEQEQAIESLLINSSPEASNDRPDIVSYDFTCDICYDIFCTKEELESHTELHLQIQERNNEMKTSDNISENSSENRTESRNKSLPSISGNTSPFQGDSISQDGSPQEGSLSNGNIDGFMSNFLRPATNKSPQVSLEVQSSVVHNFGPDITKSSVVLRQEQLSEMPPNNNSNAENQMYYMDARSIVSTNQNLVSDADGNLYIVVGCSAANSDIQSVNYAGPITSPYQETTTPSFLRNHIPVASASQSVNHAPFTNDQPIISLARLNQNIEQMLAKNSNDLEQSAVPQKSLKKNETTKKEKKVFVVKQKLVRMKKTRNKMSRTTEFEIIEESCSPQPARRKAIKANILKKKLKQLPSQKNVPTDWTPTVLSIHSDDSNGFASRGPFSCVDQHQEEYSQYSNLNSALIHGSTGLTFERKNQFFSSQTNEVESSIVHIAAEPDTPPVPVRPPRSNVVLNPFPEPAGKAPTVDRILMPKITNVMSMNSDIMESDSITVLSDEETEVATQKIISGLNTNCDDDDDDIERALPMSLIYRPDAENAGQ